MKNLKINVYPSSSVILNRYLTIDNILLNLYFNKLRKEGKINGFIDTEEYIKNEKDNLFIDYKNGVLSGSIWYIEDDEDIYLDNIIFSKKIETKKIYDVSKKKINTSRGEFKAFRFGFEILITPKIYFYIRGKKEIIESLLNELQYIGKKSSSGFGMIRNIEIEEVEEDKSFMLDEYTPAKPLPCSSWNIQSKKVAFYRSLPPYYSKENLQACYMPTKALIEKEDRSRLNKNFKVSISNYISATKFARKYSQFDEIELFNTAKKEIKHITDQEHTCIICGSKEKNGLLGNPKRILPITFNDYAFLDKGDFICSDCLWSMKQERVLGNSYIDKNEVTYLQGGKMTIKGAKEQQSFRNKFFRNLDLLKPPFLISLKSTANAQHTVFKNKVSISNAMIPISFGTDEEVLIDVELLKEAIKDMEEIFEKNKCIKKTHLLNIEKINNTFPKLSSQCSNKENIKTLQEFWKKYDRSIRKILNRVIF